MKQLTSNILFFSFFQSFREKGASAACAPSDPPAQPMDNIGGGAAAGGEAEGGAAAGEAAAGGAAAAAVNGLGGIIYPCIND